MADSWSATSMAGAPAGRGRHLAVWTGGVMIVWGGVDAGGPVGDGGRYAPNTDLWTATSQADAPLARYSSAAVWAGTSMMLWGGSEGQPMSSGGRYHYQMVVDQDGDTFGCDTDCNDADIDNWARPGEATGLAFDAPDAMSWER